MIKHILFILAFSITASSQVVLTDWNTNETATTGKTVDGTFTNPKSIAIPSWPTDPSAVPVVTVATDPTDANNQVIKFVRTTGTSQSNSLSIRWGSAHDTDNDGVNGPGTALTGISLGGGTPRPYIKFSVYSVDKTDFALRVKFQQGSKPEWKGNVKVALNTWTDIEVHYDYSNAGVVAGTLDNLAWNTVMDIGFNIDEAASNETFYVKGLTAHTDTSYSTASVLQDMSNTSNNATADVYGGFGANNTAQNTVIADPTDANNSVRQVDVTTGGDVWKGVFIRPQTHYMDLTNNPTVSLKVYSTTAAHFRGILQGGQDGQSAIDQATNTAAHGGTGWETLSFTFHGATGEWGEFAMRTSVDADGSLNTTTALTAYFDDLTAVQGSAIPVPSQPTTSPAAPTKEADDVISIFSDTYTNINVTNYNPNWNQTGSVSTEFDPGDGNNVMVYSNFNYQGTEFGATDMAAMEYLHIDIWVASDDTNTYQVSPLGGGETLVNITTTPGSWSSVDIPVTSFTAVDFSSVNQMKFAGGTGTSIYLDNIYFWKEPTATGTDASLSDLAVDGATISGFGASTSYSVPLVEGTTTIPQITAATTTDTSASAVITQATAIPGDATVVVTAADGTTTKTYTVSFFIGMPAAASAVPPSRNASDVVSFYSDSYTPVALGEYFPSWSEATVTDYPINGNNIWKMASMNFASVTQYGGIDLSQMEKMYIDYWTAQDAVGAKLFVKLVDTNDSQEVLLDLGNVVPGSWQTIEVDLNAQNTSNIDLSTVTQFLIDPSTNGGTFYIDNWYFAKGTPLSIGELNKSEIYVYPNPVQNTLNVSAGVSVDQVSIFDLTGREVMRATPNASAFSLDVANLNKGLYLVSLKAGDQEMTTKLVK